MIFGDHWVVAYFIIGVLFAESCRRWGVVHLRPLQYMVIVIFWLLFLFAIATGWLKKK